MVHILDGKALAQRKFDELKKTISSLSLTPGLGVILVGDDPASRVYVSLKEERAYELGIYVQKRELAGSIKEDELILEIEKLNANPLVHGILIQFPLPEHINANTILDHIKKEKDVDGFLLGSHVSSPIVAAILDLLHEVAPELRGLKAKLFLNSEIFFNGLSERLRAKGIEIVEDSLKADIIITAKGMAHFLKSFMIKKGAIVIDAGTVKINGKIFGDADESILAKAGYVSLVPGGVGPLTVIHLLENVVFLARRSLGRNVAL